MTSSAPPTVLLCNRLARLRQLLQNDERPIRWLAFSDTAETRHIKTYLETRSDVEALDGSGLMRQRQKEFRQSYISFNAELTKANAGLEWWALPIASKDPTVSTLCQDTAAFLLIVHLVQQGKGNLLVITDSDALAAQVKVWAKGKGIDVRCAIRPSHLWRRRLKHFSPVAVLRAFMGTLYRWLVTRTLRPTRNLNQPHTVVFTVLHDSSFSGAGGYRDVYFGPLVEHLEASGNKSLVVGLMSGPTRPQAASLKGLQQRVPVVPIEALLSWPDVFACLFRSLWLFALGMRVKGSCQIDGVDVGVLAGKGFAEASRSGNMLMSLRVHYAVRRLTQLVQVERCIYPYENRPWEKMLLLAMRRESPGTRIVGYQHAAIAPSHLHFFMGQGEHEATPLPDVLLTTGEVTQGWLESEGGYPPGIVRAGCALRHHTPSDAPTTSSVGGNSRRLLVALGHAGPENLREYVATLTLVHSLRTMTNGTTGPHLVVRPHPTNQVPLVWALDAAGLSREPFYDLSTGDLRVALEESCAVAYAASTVAVEAASLGLPTIYLDLGEALDTDPMWAWEDLKWRATGPEEVLDAWDAIQALTPERRESLSRRAWEYSRSYLCPVTEKGISFFLEA